MYKYETHSHCSLCSACGRSTPQELIQAYHDAGYSGLVLTDHFFFGNTAVDRAKPWSEFVKAYYDAYLSAKPFAKSLDFDLLFGLEHAYGSGKELLLYGIDLEFLLDNPDIPKISVDELVKRVHDYGGIAIQAHPYRDRDYIDMSVGPRTDIVDGVEIFNACNEPKDNKLAFDKLGKKDFIYTCGGDVHSHTQTDKFSGIALPYRVRNEKEFVSALKNKDHSYIINDKTVDEIDEEILM